MNMEAVKTCKLFGAIRAILGIKDALPLIHGPIGCAYHIRYLLSARSGIPLKILTTGMTQNDIVFGAEEKLEKQIIKIDKEYSPNLIVVLTSCASSIIGEDVGRVLKKIKNNIKSEIISINAGGFEGTQIDGYEETLSALVQLMDKKNFENSSINLVSQFRGGPDLKNLKSDINKLKVNINCVLTSGSTFEDVKNASSASLNVSMCEASGIIPSELMQERFGIPFLSEVAPIGVSSSANFFHKISDYFKVEYNLKDDERKAKYQINKISGCLSDKKVVIIAGSTRAIALANFVCELKMDPVLISLDFEGRDTSKNLKKVIKNNGINPIILREPEYFELLKDVKGLEPDLILGGLGEIGLSKNLDIPLIDVMHAQEITMSFQGARILSKNIKNQLA
jgi:light-independent protochlorophyllide reductase B subunit